jgi:hypothetical protein
MRQSGTCCTHASKAGMLGASPRFRVPIVVRPTAILHDVYFSRRGQRMAGASAGPG